jgi:hypothetical protein
MKETILHLDEDFLHLHLSSASPEKNREKYNFENLKLREKNLTFLPFARKYVPCVMRNVDYCEMCDAVICCYITCELPRSVSWFPNSQSVATKKNVEAHLQSVSLTYVYPLSRVRLLFRSIYTIHEKGQ